MVTGLDPVFNKNNRQLLQSCGKGAWDGVLTLPEQVRAYANLVDDFGSFIHEAIRQKSEWVTKCSNSIYCKRQIARMIPAYSARKPGAESCVTADRTDPYRNDPAFICANPYKVSDFMVEADIEKLDLMSLADMAAQARSSLQRTCEVFLSEIDRKIRDEQNEADAEITWGDKQLQQRYDKLVAKDPDCPTALKLDRPDKNPPRTPDSKKTTWLESLGIQWDCYSPEKVDQLICMEIAKQVVDPLNLLGGSGALATKALKLAGVGAETATQVIARNAIHAAGEEAAELAAKKQLQVAKSASAVPEAQSIPPAPTRPTSEIDPSELLPKDQFDKFPDGLTQEEYARMIRGSGTANDPKAITYVSDGLSHAPKPGTISEKNTALASNRDADPLRLISVDQYNSLPDGTVLEGVHGDKYIKGVDYIDLGTRRGWMAYGFRDSALNGVDKYHGNLEPTVIKKLDDLKTKVEEKKQQEQKLREALWVGNARGTDVEKISRAQKALAAAEKKDEDLRDVVVKGKPLLTFRTPEQKKVFYEASAKIRTQEISVAPTKQSAIQKNIELNKSLGRTPERIDANGIPVFAPGASQFRAMVVKAGDEARARAILDQVGWQSGSARGVKIAPEDLSKQGATRLTEQAKFEDAVVEFVGPKGAPGSKAEHGFNFPRDSRVVGVSSSSAVVDVAMKTAGDIPKGSFVMVTEIVPRNKKLVNSDQLLKGRELTPKYPTTYTDGGIEHAVSEVETEEIVNVIFIPIGN